MLDNEILQLSPKFHYLPQIPLNLDQPQMTIQLLKILHNGGKMKYISQITLNALDQSHRMTLKLLK